MQDIRKPYSRSKSNRDLSARIEAFEENAYDEREKDDDRPVEIPIGKSFRSRRNIDHMEMYPRRRREDREENPRVGGHGDIVYRDPRTRYERNRNSWGTWAFIITIVVLVTGAALLTYVFDRATITIVPKYEDLTGFRNTFSFIKAGEVGSGIPFIVATSTLTKSKSLPLSETKKVESKASGKIIVYNNYDSEPQKLIKNTRFEGTNGKIYRINESITVPGKKGSTPGSIKVTVYADSYGIDYNSQPMDFTIPGFKGTPRYTAFFGRSDGPITGGASGNMSLASQADVDAAKDELAIEVAQKIKSDLMSVKKNGYTGLYNMIDVQYSDNEMDVINGVTSTYEVKAIGYLMFAETPALAKAIANSAVRNYQGESVRLGYEDTLSYAKKDSDTIATSTKLDVLIEGTPRIIWTTDETILKGLVVGKRRDEFKTIMSGIDSIKGAEISFSPLWLSQFPGESSKISVVEDLPKR